MNPLLRSLKYHSRLGCGRPVAVRLGALALGAAVVLLAPQATAAPEPVDQVNVFTGTSNSRWMLFPGATLPFGLVKLSPDNQSNVWNGGYEYTVGSVSGFSHLHAFTLSGLSVMPVTGPMEYNPGLFRVFPGSPDGPFGAMWTSGYRSRIDKQTERGTPGYYAVDLTDWKVRAELTATLRCGVMRFTFPRTDEAHLVLDFGFPTEELTKILSVSVQRTADNEIAGEIRQANGYAGEYRLYFVLRTSRPLRSLDAWQRERYAGAETGYGTDWRCPVDYRRDVREFSGRDTCGVALNFATEAAGQIVVQTGLSLTDLGQARRNLEVEVGKAGGDFDTVARQARETWNQLLGAVEVGGGTPEQRAMVYTNLYRAYAAKSLLQDADGSYRSWDGSRHQTKDAIYSSDAFWGSQWTLFPLWTLVSPRVASSWVHFLLEAADRGGWTPQAPVRGGYSPVMVAQHQLALIVSSYQKGIRDFDAERAWRAIKHDLTTPGTPIPGGGYAGDRNLAAYLKHGYVPDGEGPTSNTFEYAYDDWTAGQFAAALGHEDDAREFLRRAGNWRNAIDPQLKIARPRRADGSWAEPFDPHRFGTVGGWNGTGFVEGTPWVYTWFVPHEPGALVAWLGAEEFTRRLEEGFAKEYVDIGNETNLHAPFLFNYAGRPWLTQKHVREALVSAFDASPLGGWRRGEEDEGQLGALFVLWSMGLFQMDGGCSARPYYDLGSPLFERVVLHLDPRYYPGGKFEIVAHGNGPVNIYVQSAKLNGRPLTQARIYHDEIVAGGTLELEMGPQPNTAWGAYEASPEKKN